MIDVEQPKPRSPRRRRASFRAHTSRIAATHRPKVAAPARSPSPTFGETFNGGGCRTEGDVSAYALEERGDKGVAVNEEVVGRFCRRHQGSNRESCLSGGLDVAAEAFGEFVLGCVKLSNNQACELSELLLVNLSNPQEIMCNNQSGELPSFSFPDLTISPALISGSRTLFGDILQRQVVMKDPAVKLSG
nr:hypothetical protein Iba_chr03bCG10120 [Ipomoea batatas]